MICLQKYLEVSKINIEYIKTNWQDGDIITADKMNNIENGLDAISQDASTIETNINKMTIEEKLLRSELPETTQIVTLDSNGNPTMITHSISGVVIRTDAFTWTENSVTEVRTASNKQITLTTNLTTLEQTISAITEAI